ncbi:MAG: exopolysaccharide Pel transporter PelG [Methylococcales bacterium]|nr:exopolysaccharide Pel transporter PelG [Methylococcales bacterium]
MAGIGFVLRKLSNEDNLSGVVKGYLFSAIVFTGPWLFTIFSFGVIMAIGSYFLLLEELAVFRLIVIYNFAFSLVFSAPVFMVATRYLADLIYAKDVSLAPGMLFGAFAILCITQLPIAGFFYLGYANLDTWTGFAALSNYFLITGIWLVTTFLSALKAYLYVSGIFAIGMCIALGGAALLAAEFSIAGMLMGYNIGLAVIFFGIVGRIFVEYPHPIIKPFAIFGYFRKYWDIALSGLIYNLAIWSDKWLMWFAPEREILYSGLISYPNYDSAMFLAFLTLVPAMALFVFSIETQFFERYLKYYKNIQDHSSYSKIESNHQEIIDVIVASLRNLFVLQGSLCFAVILLAPTIFSSFGINYLQLGIFRLGVLGALFHVMMMFLGILLSYFDFRRVVLSLQCFFFICNFGFTYLSLQFGFLYYGYGYFLAAMFSFIATFIVTLYYVNQLPFQTFIGHNTSIE